MARRRRRQASPLDTLTTVCVAAVGGLMVISWDGKPNSWNTLFAAILLAALMPPLLLLTFHLWQNARRYRALWRLMDAEVDRMTGLQFENYVAELFRRRSYRVTMTPPNDYGVDIILTKNGVRTAVQTKRYSKPVAQAAVREVVAGMAPYRCSRSIVVTNNAFTKAARELARSNHCTLMDRTELARLAEAVRTKA